MFHSEIELPNKRARHIRWGCDEDMHSSVDIQKTFPAERVKLPCWKGLIRIMRGGVVQIIISDPLLMSEMSFMKNHVVEDRSIL